MNTPARRADLAGVPHPLGGGPTGLRWARGARQAAFAVFAAAIALSGCGGDAKGNGDTTEQDQGGFGGEDASAPGGSPDTGGADLGTAGVDAAGGAPVGGADAGGGTTPPPCECPRNLTCDAAGQCVERTPCAADVDCAEGRICTGGACADGCADDAACAASAPADHCVEGRCIQCAGDGDCYGQASCDAATGLCVEPATCTDSRECNAPNSCNSRTATCTPPRNCNNPEQACRGGLVCGEDGRCRQPPECASNEECPFGQICAMGRPRSCRPCQANEECGARQVCDRGTCVDGGCEADADCVGGRVCVAAACVAPACADDASEDNDVPDRATLLAGATSFGAQACGGDDDYYRFTLDRGSAAAFTIEVDGLDAELDIELTDAAGTAVAVGNADGIVDSVVAGPFALDRDLIARVYQRGAPSAVAYAVRLDIVPAGADVCVDDAVDIARNDDTQAEATSLRAAGAPAIDLAVEGKACPGDDDWMCLSLGEDEDLSIVGSVTAGDVVLQAELVSASNGMTVQQVEWTRGMEGMPLSRAVRGNYCLHLHPQSGSGAYRVHIATVDRAADALCRAAAVLDVAAGSAQVRGRLAQNDVMTASCGDSQADGGEALYALHVDAPKLLVARATGLAGGTLGDPLLSIRSECVAANSELGCNDDRPEPEAPFLVEANPAELRLPLEAAGDYTLIVDGTDPGASPDFQLDVELLALAAAPANDRCAAPADLVLQDGLGRIRVNLDRAHDDVAGSCLPGNGPDAVYRLHVAERSRVAAQVFADFGVGVYLTSACGGGDTLACGSGFDLADVGPGDYFLVVEGVGSQGRGRVQGQVVVEPFGPAPANDVCGGAVQLDAAGGTLQGDTRGARDESQLGANNRCTGQTSAAPDVYYTMPVAPGTTYFVEAVPEQGWDLSLYVVTDCAHPGESCVAGHDGALTERVEFVAPPGAAQVTLVVDGANGEAGPFALSWGTVGR